MRRHNAESRAAAREFLRSMSPELLRYFERRVDPREDAADLLSETLLIAWRKVETVAADDTDRRRAWLYTIAANVLANHRRSLRRRRALADTLRATLAMTSDAPEWAELEVVRDAVARLPEAQRELVRLVHWEGLSINEAAAALGLNASTARSRYGVAKGVLRSALSTDGELLESVLGH